MKPYVLAKINDYNGDLSRRWYVEYKFHDEKTQKFKKHRIWISMKIDTLEKRREIAEDICFEINDKLMAGWNPIEGISINQKRLIDVLWHIHAIKEATSRKTTANAYKLGIRKMIVFLYSIGGQRMKVDQFGKRHALALTDHLKLERKLANKTFNNHLIIYRSIFNELVNRDLVKSNPFKSVKPLYETQTDINPFNPEDFRKLYEYLQVNDPCLLNVAKFIYYCGFRTNEVAQLRVKDVNLETGFVTLPADVHKTRRQRGMPLRESFVQDLQFIKKYPPDYYIFSTGLTPGHKCGNSRYIQKRYKKVKDSLELSNRLYDLKHTMACWLIRNKVNLMSIKNYLGHTDVEHTMIYIRSVEEYGANELKDLIPEMKEF
jgi:integrase